MVCAVGWHIPDVLAFTTGILTCYILDLSGNILNFSIFFIKWRISSNYVSFHANKNSIDAFLTQSKVLVNLLSSKAE